MSAQTDEQILNEILFKLFEFQKDTILIENAMRKTYFEYDSISFEIITGLTVPSEIIFEWKQNEEKEGFIAQWNEQYLNKRDTIFYENDTIIVKKPIFKCLSRNEINQIFVTTQKRQRIYSISKILFDNSKENAIFHFTVIPWMGAFYTETILIKKVFGKWVIIMRFDFAMS
jgi:hypothetical protein